MPDAIKVIALYHNDVVSSLILYFSNVSPSFNVSFLGYSPTEVSDELKAHLDETDRRSALALLISLEAAFRVDYERRCQQRMKDDLSRAFRRISKSRKRNVRLDEDIFESWVRNVDGSAPLIGALRSAFRFRHWLAHGSYWEPKLGRKYDFPYVYDLADNVLKTLSFLS